MPIAAGGDVCFFKKLPVEKIKTMTHYLSSKEELWSRLKAQASKQGLVYDKASDKFLSNNTKSNK